MIDSEYKKNWKKKLKEWLTVTVACARIEESKLHKGGVGWGSGIWGTQQDPFRKFSKICYKNAIKAKLVVIFFNGPLFKIYQKSLKKNRPLWIFHYCVHPWLDLKRAAFVSTSECSPMQMVKYVSNEKKEKITLWGRFFRGRNFI